MADKQLLGKSCLLSAPRKAAPPIPDLLARVPIFAALDARGRDRLMEACRVRTFKAGQILFHEGDPGHSLYVLRSGQVKISRLAADGEETILAIAGPGECLGEMALLDDEPRSATVTALDRVEALVLQREEFLALLERCPALGRGVMEHLATRVRRLNEQVQDALLLDAPGRIARWLLLLAEQFGQATPEGIRIPALLSREELAQMVGTARETVSRELSRLVDQQVLKVDRDGLLLLRPERLQRRLY